MKIVVAGTGYVGLVTGACLSEVGHNVICVDVDEKKVEIMKKGISPIYEPGLDELLERNYKEGRLDFTTDYKNAYKNADIVFIGVGTPERADGSANLDYVFTVCSQIAENLENDCLVVVKSTVPIGTNDKVEAFLKENVKEGINIEVASNPEFLAQGTAVVDTLRASRIVIGVESERAENTLREVYERFNQPIVATNRRSAEMIKYASNDFLALKISFMNEIANFCEIVGADIEDVAKGMSYDPRIGDKFLRAGIGYGGSCFPKDTKALHWLANDNGYEIKTIKATIEVNQNQKLKMFREAKKRFGDLKGKKVGAQMGSIQAEIAKGIEGADVKLLDNVNTLILELKTGKLDAVITELPVAKIASEVNSELAVADEVIKNSEGGSAIAIQKGNKDLVDEVNSTIKELKENGKIDQFTNDAIELVPYQKKEE